MLNNFIYAQTKDLFLEQLGAGNILDEAIVFIADTKEIWNHGTYFGRESDFDADVFAALQQAVLDLQNATADINTDLDKKLDKTAIDKNGDGTKFLSDDGTYRSVDNTYNLDYQNWNGKESHDELLLAVNSGKTILCDGATAMVWVTDDRVERVFCFVNLIESDNLIISALDFTFDSDYNIIENWKDISLTNSGDGSLFLSDDGTYKFVETNPFEIPANGVLPETGKVGKIYLIPASVTGENNIMHEYVWANDAWEKLGEFKASVDLSGYYTKEEIDSSIETITSELEEIDKVTTAALADLDQRIIDMESTSATNDANVLSDAKLYVDAKETALRNDLTLMQTSIDSKLDISVANNTYATMNAITGKQDELVSGQNIKTFNGQSILGEGDISIDTTTFASKDDLDRKQNKLVNGSTIKSINNETLLGPGNITIDTSVFDTTGDNTERPMSQKATTDAINAETERALTVENELFDKIEAHEALTQQASQNASDANAYAQEAFSKSSEAVNIANTAKNAVAALEGINAGAIQEAISETIVQIEQNTTDIEVLKNSHVVLSEEEYAALELKDPDKFYIVYEE